VANAKNICHFLLNTNMHLLVPYVELPDHADPLFNEFTYERSKIKKYPVLLFVPASCPPMKLI